jgi:cytochrome c oxidase subunit 4
MSETSSPANAAESEGHDDHGFVHVVPLRVLVVVVVSLAVLTYVTVAVAGIDLSIEGVGSLNLVIAMAIATVKASLVALYFMHLRYDHPFNGLALVIALVFLALFLCLTLLDTFQYQPDIQNWQ